MSDNNLSGKVSLDTTDYKTGVSELNRQIRVIESGFRASAASMEDWDKTAEGLEMRNKALSSEMDLQKQKIAALTGEYKKIVAEKGADSRAAEEMQIKINKETQALNKSESELKKNERALEDTRKETKNLGDEQTKTEKKTLSLKDAMKGLGTVLAGVGKAVAAVAAAALAAVGALAGLVLKSAAAAGTLEDTAAKTGLAVEELQELAYVAKVTGTDIETVNGASAKLVKNMASAREGTGAAADAFEMLNIKVTDSNGELRNSQDVFQEALTQLGGMTNETERDAAAMAIFGKSARELNPLIETSAEDIKRLREESHLMGAVVSKENVNSLAKFDEILDKLKLGLSGIAMTIASSFLPQFQAIGSGMQGYMQQLSAVVSGSNGNVGEMAKGIGGLLGNIVKDIAGKAPEMVKAGMGFIGGLGSSLLSSLPMIIDSVLEIANTVVSSLGGSLPTIITTLIPLLFKAVSGLLVMLPQILSILMQLLVSVFQGVSAQLPTLIPLIMEVLLQVLNVLISNLPMVLTAIMQLMMGAAQGIVAAIPILLEQIPVILESLVSFLIENLPMLLVAAVNIILTLAFGILENIPLLLSTIPKLISALVKKFKSPEFKAQMKSMGTELINGLKEGWNNAWEKFKENISKGFKDLIKWIKALLGIASPAKIMMPIGGSLPDGAGVGWLASFKNLKRLVADSMLELTTMSAANLGGLTNNLSLGGAGGGQFSSQTDTYQFFAPVILQGGAGVSLGQAIKSKRY